jgi:hypothetical protein
VLLGDRGKHEDANERLAFGGALSQAEASTVRGVLDQRAQAVERLRTQRGKVCGARPVLELGDQLFQLRTGILGAAALLLAQSRVLLLELLEALEQVGRRILRLGVARSYALSNQTLEMRLGGAGHVAGSWARH